MIQILGIRKREDNPNRKKEVFFSNKWRVNDVKSIFKEPKKILDHFNISENERHNLYFTVASCLEEPGRKMVEQWLLPFDIDRLVLPEGQEHETARNVAKAACVALNVPYSDIGVIFSGNGVQLFILLDVPINSPEYFEATRIFYKAVCDKITKELLAQGLSGEVDTSVFSAARLMRMPETLNIKDGKPTRRAVVLQGDMVPIAYDLIEASGLNYLEAVSVIKSAQSIPKDVIVKYHEPDSEGVLTECDFMVNAKNNADKIQEPAWYAMLSILAHLPDGLKYAHAYSQGHKGYDAEETEEKFNQAKDKSGPRTCTNIATMFDCGGCKHFKKLTSPIQIKGPNYIKTKDTGYREVTISKEGIPKPGKPSYEDLIRQFEKEFTFTWLDDLGLFYIYNGKFWEELSETHIAAWLKSKLMPWQNLSEQATFLNLLRTISIGNSEEFFSRYSYGMMNFQNGVYDIIKNELHPHDKKYSFSHVLPYAYNAEADAPKFKQFLHEITMGDKSIETILCEFAGYCISGMDPRFMAKALILVGDGGNGKSVFVDIIEAVAGKENVSAVAFQDMGNEQNRQTVVRKLFNYSEETNVKALMDSSTFKAMVDGGKVTVKKLYSQPVSIKTMAKIVMLCNELPYINDTTEGMFRRLLIIKLKNRFLGIKRDPLIKEKLFEELPGICNLFISSFREVISTKQFTSSESSSLLLETLKFESSSTKQYIYDCLAVDVDNIETMSEVYDSYEIYCKKNKLMARNPRGLAADIRTHFNIDTTSVRRGNAVVKSYKGIRITNKEF